jgi:hypothetical protein
VDVLDRHVAALKVVPTPQISRRIDVVGHGWKL